MLCFSLTRGGHSGSACLSHSKEGCWAHKVCTKCLMIDWLIGKRQIWVWRTGCQFQMVPWARTGGNPGNSAPENHRLSITCIKHCWEEAKRSKKELRSYSSWVYGLHSIFISPLPTGRIFPGALASTYNPLQVCTHLYAIRSTWRKNKLAHDSISFPPSQPSTILSIIFPFFFFFFEKVYLLPKRKCGLCY